MAVSDREVPGPPPHLSERAQALWREVVPRRAVSPERLALLQVALEALERADAASAIVTQSVASRIFLRRNGSGVSFLC